MSDEEDHKHDLMMHGLTIRKVTSDGGSLRVPLGDFFKNPKDKKETK